MAASVGPRPQARQHRPALACTVVLLLVTLTAAPALGRSSDQGGDFGVCGAGYWLKLDVSGAGWILEWGPAWADDRPEPPTLIVAEDGDGGPWAVDWNAATPTLSVHTKAAGILTAFAGGTSGTVTGAEEPHPVHDGELLRHAISFVVFCFGEPPPPPPPPPPDPVELGLRKVWLDGDGRSVEAPGVSFAVTLAVDGTVLATLDDTSPATGVWTEVAPGTTYVVAEPTLPEGWRTVDCPDGLDLGDGSVAADGPGSFVAGSSGHHVVCNRLVDEGNGDDDGDDRPPVVGDVTVELRKEWFAADGSRTEPEPGLDDASWSVELLVDDEPAAAIPPGTGTGGRTAAATLVLGTDYRVTENAPDGWQEVGCATVTGASAAVATGTGTGFTATADGVHLVCNQVETAVEPIVTERPAIGLTKTARLDPDRDGNRVVVHGADGGGRIAYDYVITNTGETELADLRLVDDVLGDVALPTATVLAADEELTVTATHTLTRADVEAGRITNTATVTGTAPDGTSVEASATETVLVVEVAGRARRAERLPSTGGELLAVVVTALLAMGVGGLLLRRSTR